MSINIYWACLEKEWMLAEQPESVPFSFYEKKLFNDKNNFFNLNKCPAFNDRIQNTFSIKSIYDYSFDIFYENNEKIIKSNNFDQNFFNEHIIIRDIEKNAFSFLQRYIFFTDEQSLKTDFYIMPYLEENNSIMNSCVLIPGTYDIAKWYRAVEFPFFLKNNCNNFSIYRNQILYYIKFNTNKKINFVQYRSNEILEQMEKDGFSLNVRGMNIKKMENYYKFFKNKNKILNEIKNNIIN